MNQNVKIPRKLIEVALPLDAINAAAVREKSMRHGHPNTLHLWWARRPLAAARAVIFSQLVNDPGYQQGDGFKYGENKKDAAVERKRLFKIMEELVRWENTTNEEVLEKARKEIRRSWREVCELNKDHPQADELFNPDKLPALHDPFAGGGAIPLEAQRLGLNAYASDLNPVAVLINKAMIEIPPKFSNRPPVNPDMQKNLAQKARWKGATGLAEDVRYYGKWMRDLAEKRIGHLYPKVAITKEMTAKRSDLKQYVGRELTVIAWLWARTVKSPNPAFAHVDVPLISNFMLSTKREKEAYIEPLIKGDTYRFTVKVGKPKDPDVSKAGTKMGRGSTFRCLLSGAPISGDYIKAEGQAGRMGERLMAIVTEGDRGRVYIAPTQEMEAIAHEAKPEWRPENELIGKCRDQLPLYGMNTFADIFTPRQLVALTTFSDLVQEVIEQVKRDAITAGLPDDDILLRDGGNGAIAYAEAVGVYLAFLMSQLANHLSTICGWHVNNTQLRNSFGRQALPMTWDYAESNPLCNSTGSFNNLWERQVKGLATLEDIPGLAFQLDAMQSQLSVQKVVSTDPPYYDNICYADLSDFFYVWLRRSLRSVFPDLFATLATPKADELVASRYRHGSKDKAETFFLDGMTQAMQRLVEQAHPGFPVTIYYAFKQAERKGDGGTISTGWETFLEAVNQAGFQLSGTWPIRTEMKSRQIAAGTNALASSIVLVCRKRSVNAPVISRREFLRELDAVLPEALDEMTRGAGEDRSPVAPVDLSQAIIGPGMAVFSKYQAVLEADGTPMPVRTALQLINRYLAEDDFDTDTQFCLHWFEQYGWREGPYGDADTLSRAKGTSVDGVENAGVIASGGGQVRLHKWSEYPTNWNPHTDSRNPIWETLHHLIRTLKQAGETVAGAQLGAVKSQREATRQLAYRLYTLCERKGWAEDARAYNELITSWTGIESAVVTEPVQSRLFE